MTKAIVLRADGNDEATGRATQSWWGNLISNAGNIISSTTGGIASIVQAKTGNYPTYQQPDNTPKILAVAGVFSVVLIVVLLVIFKK